MVQLYIESEIDSSHQRTIQSAVNTMAKQFQSEGLSARQAVIHMMEATHLMPGVFNVQMLSWRQRLQELVHEPGNISGFSSLNYPLKRSAESISNVPAFKTVATQTILSNPNTDGILEFLHKQYQLRWTLDY